MEESTSGPMIVRAANANGFIRTNKDFSERVGFSDADLAEKPFLDWIDPDDRSAVQSILDEGVGSCIARHRTPCGGGLPLNIKVSGEGPNAYVLARCADAADHAQFSEEVVDETTVRGTLHTIARIVEAQLPGYKCSILLVRDGRFVKGAGPSLPEDYNAAVDGYAIGPTVGSCGTAIYWNAPVIVEDIQQDPLWADLAALAKAAGVAACWSHPFTSKNGNVLGALALYAPEPKSPTAEQLSLLQAAARMTGLAVERGRAEEALREQRKREQELENQLRQAAKMEALGVLAGGVAHDFNNVLATILGNAELAAEMSPPDGDVKLMLDEIVEASQRAGSFCQQLLAYSGKSKVSTSEIELGSLLPQLSSLVQAAISKKAKLEYALIEEPVFINGNENQLLQVIMNLVINAADAIGDKEGVIEVGTELAYYDTDELRRIAPKDELAAGNYVRVKVRDNGSGIDPEKLDRIFDPFFTTKTTGRGLGLAAVKGIVSAHLGTIQIDSELGVGTTFTVLLPVTEPTEGKKPATAKPPANPERQRVLVIDDNRNLRLIVSRWLKRSGFDVLEASDGQEGIEIFHESPESINCVLLDLNMPRLSGDEVYKEICRARQDLPVILMSGTAEQEVLQRFDGADLAGILQKPVPASKIVDEVRRAVA